METNKYIELNQEDQDKVSDLALNEVDRFKDSIIGETNINTLAQHCVQHMFKLLTEKEAIILELTREVEAWKSAANKHQ